MFVPFAYIDEDNVCQWPEFQSFIFECFKSPEPGLREVACHLFANVPAVFGPDPTPLLRDIGHMLHQALQDTSPKVRVAGFRALSAFLVQNAPEASVQNALKDLVQPAIMVIIISVLICVNQESNLIEFILNCRINVKHGSKIVLILLTVFLLLV